MRREPTVYIAAFTSLIVALVGILTIFGLNVSPDTQDKIVTAVTAAITAIVLIAPVIRGFVYSPDAHDKAVEGAFKRGENGQAPPITIP